MTVMSDYSRTTPLGWDGHIMLLHGSESERTSDLAAWVRRGLENDEKVIYTEAREAPPERSVIRMLLGKGIDVVAATSEGRFAVLPLPEFYPPQGHAEMVERALAKGYRGLRISAEASAALTFMPPSAYRTVERSIDQLCRTHRLSALCQYQQLSTTGDHLQDAAFSHVGGGIRQRALHTGHLADQLVLVGEIDVSNYDILTCALRAAGEWTSQVLRLDLSQVEFLGAAGCRALDLGTSAFRERGGRVLLIEPEAPVERILRLAGIDRLEHVELIGGYR